MRVSVCDFGGGYPVKNWGQLLAVSGQVWFRCPPLPGLAQCQQPHSPGSPGPLTVRTAPSDNCGPKPALVSCFRQARAHSHSRVLLILSLSTRDGTMIPQTQSCHLLSTETLLVVWDGREMRGFHSWGPHTARGLQGRW